MGGTASEGGGGGGGWVGREVLRVWRADLCRGCSRSSWNESDKQRLQRRQIAVSLLFAP